MRELTLYQNCEIFSQVCASVERANLAELFRVIIFGGYAMMKMLLTCFVVCFVGSAQAATWNMFKNAWNSEKVFFFDADTVEKQGDAVTVWVKYVRNTALPPEYDGGYARASRVLYRCATRGARTLSYSVYNRNGQFMSSIDLPVGFVNFPVYIGAEIFRVVCAKEFPNSKAGIDYFEIVDNDIFRHAAIFFESYADQAPR